MTTTLQSQLQALNVDITVSLEQLNAPAALLDPSGTVLWQNPSSIKLLGDHRGMRFTAIAPDYQQETRAILARRMHGVDLVDYRRLVLIDREGQRKRVETISLSLTRGSQVVGVLTLVRRVTDEGASFNRTGLTPRQHETLTLLASGLSTEQVANGLGVSRETARNYIRRLLRIMGVHSRLEAVVKGRDTGLL
jgi:DNA-binding CsgD family transcriptional regulator